VECLLEAIICSLTNRKCDFFQVDKSTIQVVLWHLTVIRRTHRVVESLHPTEFPFKSLRVFDRKRLYLVNLL